MVDAHFVDLLYVYGLLVRSLVLVLLFSAKSRREKTLNHGSCPELGHSG